MKQRTRCVVFVWFFSLIFLVLTSSLFTLNLEEYIDNSIDIYEENANSTPESAYNNQEQAYIGVSPDQTYDNETLGVLNTSKPIIVYLNDSDVNLNISELMLSDLKEFFGKRYNSRIIHVDDELAYEESDIRNNSIIIGNETINNATAWLMNNGFTPSADAQGDGFNMQTFSMGTNSCVVIRGGNRIGDANGVFWLIDRCRTQEFGSVDFNYTRNADLSFRLTGVSISVPNSYDNDSVRWQTLNTTFEMIDGAIRRRANKLLLGGDYKYIGQYPQLCNYSWNIDIQSRLGSDWNLTVINARRGYVNQIIDYINSMGAEAFFWADQLNTLSDGVDNWLNENDKIDIQNERVKTLIQGQLEEVFTAFPDVAGIMLRVGDDLYSEYSAQLMYDPRSFKETTNALMEVVNAYNKTFVLRTWQMSVQDDCCHASPIAYREAFEDMTYENLIICIKYTPNDYQRIPINPTFNICSLKQLVELQTINSFENYQYTPLCQVSTWHRVIENLTTTTNATGDNLLIGVFNNWGHEKDLNTSDIEGPKSENDFRREGQFYVMQRLTWNTSFSVERVCKDLTGKILGRKPEIRNYFWQWYNLSDWVHWHLLYLPGHRENAPWLKSRWLHYVRYIKTDPQAFGYVYYFCRHDINSVIDSVNQGRLYSYDMQKLIVSVAGNVSAQNQIYLDYYINKAQKMVDFAELGYWYIRTAMHWWKYLETLNPGMLQATYEDLPNLKLNLDYYEVAYHYNFDPEEGHKEGLFELYGFVRWIDTYITNAVIGFTLALLCLVILTLAFTYSKENNIFTLIVTAFRHPNRLTQTIEEKTNRVDPEEPSMRDGRKKINIGAGLILLIVPCSSGILFSMASFWLHPIISFFFAFTAILTMELVLLIFSTIMHGRGRADKSLADRIEIGFRLTGYTAIVALPMIVIFALYIAIKTPIGIFTSPFTFGVLKNPRFQDFTPMTIDGIALLLIALFTPLWGVCVLIANSPNASKVAFKKKLLVGTFVYLLSLIAVAAMLMAWFPDFLSNIDFYLNHALGVYHPDRFY
ncbi:MAG: hypothetical protein GF364_08965 [Candidatus Lokiarchaeota archaeon]|nr:hypothetical protein [Candidatus Lokiarchaeota archaeon]